ncbi:MAG: UTP--glucose-1-phosphate uridylyltransferase [Rhodospirillaceae bacterium]|nr:UTP--glucose-1-phosphate uridylyltransferase [Rhodospirillaceae bacterium]MYH35619.1 UTP--glucose-1-phosphate uridylyltransferase [Rhodospirillaceae bacterium]MYK16313.1 UTP--glucose-1-phosphate uridylyltransferase [Rhodospirillaceae bacterium]
MAKPIRKAVFPVAGLGTRFLPATKAVPKEMLPVVDRPLIDYAVAEAAEAGVTHMIFVTSGRNTALEHYYSRDTELEKTLKFRGKIAERDQLAAIVRKGVLFEFANQPEPLGLGHAVWCAKESVGDEPFAVLLPDDLVQAKPGCLAQMFERYRKTGGNLLAVENVPADRTNRYGILEIGTDEKLQGGLAEVKGLVEKPSPAEAPSTLAVIGRYILQPEIFAALEGGAPGAGGEIQLTDAIAAVIGRQPVHGYRFKGVRFDCGDSQGLVTANVAISLVRPDFDDIGTKIRVLLDSDGTETLAFDTDETGEPE